MNRTLLIGMISLVTVHLSACTCSDASCEDRLEITATQTLPSRYSAHITLDGTNSVVACDFDDPAGPTAVVTGDSDLLIECRLDGITLYAAPEKVTARFADEMGTTIVERTFEPSYEEEFANGEMCGPVCGSAQVSL